MLVISLPPKGDAAKSQQILSVEDEQDLLAALEYNLGREGYRTLTASTGTEALKQMSREEKPNLVLLDLMLPDMTGTEVCR